MKNLSSNVVSVVILNCIKQNFQLEYEDWEKRIGKEIKYFEGFIAISNKKLEGVNNEYFTIFQFDTPYNLNKWQNSNTLKRFLNEMKNILYRNLKSVNTKDWKYSLIKHKQLFHLHLFIKR